ncbi:MAG TPA: protein kinase [Kofleriaceae bacterium]|jgi:serine/threonine protein kinase/predicted ATPase/class 3 adenylate cyclase
MEQFGKYQLIRRIGAGGMAEVFLARTSVAQGLTKQLVIKKIHPAFARSRQFAAMFVDEARIALGLNHPNIVQVFDFGQMGETYFLAMEYVEGLDLLRLMQEVARRRAAIPFGLCAYAVQQVAKGLDYAHRKTDDFGEPLGIVHRDISPQNVLLSFDGAVKIVDFGIARARDVHEEEGVVKGKFAYMAPEQARGELVDRRADVYSAGVVLFELATGRPLHAGKGREVLDQVKTGAIPRPREVNPEIPEALEEIILRSLTFHRDDRFQTGRDFQNALGRFQFDVGREAGGLFDSGSLAQFISHALKPGDRPMTQRPPSSPPASFSRGPLGVPSERDSARGSGENSQRPAETRPVRHSGGIAAVAEPGVDPAEESRKVAAEPAGRREARERKHVLVLEGRIGGTQELERRLGRREALRLLQDFFSVVRDIAYKHEAYVHRIDESGLTLVVGLPVASEEDPSRTIRLALALIDALDAIGLDVEPELRLAIGIQRGVALVRRASGARFGYELSAATTGMARRLASEAQGGDILCGGAVARVASGDWAFQEMATIELPIGGDDGEDTASGGSRSARVHRVRGPKERAQRMRERERGLPATGLFGRQLELKALRDAYREVLVKGEHRQVVIVGEEGVGKGALVSAFLETLGPGEAMVLRAAARAATSFTPLGILADLGRELLGLAEGAEPREVVRRLEQALRLFYRDKEDEPEVRAQVRAIAPLLGGRAEDGAEMDADERRERIKQLLYRLEREFAPDRPLVVVVEDAHWADDQSLEMFGDLALAPQTRGLMNIFTSRPEQRIQQLASARDAVVVRMDELDEESRMAMVMSRLTPDDSARELARHILSRTGGNAMFIREMIDALVDRSILVADPADGEHPGRLRWVVRDAPLMMPATVESLLVTRIDRLPSGEKEALICASVLGRRFPAGLIDQLLGRPAGDAVAALVERRLLRKEGSQLAFRNDLTMGAAYGLIPEEERTALHRAAAAHLSAAVFYRPGQDDALIARHLELAGDGEGAADRYLRAAAHAMDVGGSQDALRQLTRALKLLPAHDHERRFTARSQRELVLRRLARRPAQLRDIDAMRREAEALGAPDKLAVAHSRQAQFYIDVRRLPAALKAAAPALQYAREAKSPLYEAEALRLRAEVARLTGQNAEALKLCEQALALCDNDKDGLSQRATILNNRGTTLWNMGQLHESIDAYAETLVIYRMLKQPRLEARALNNMGVVFSALGEAEEALAHYKSALKLDQELGDRAAIALKLGNIGQCYADIGDLERGERYLAKALKICQEGEDRSSMTDVLISIGQVHFQRGDTGGALEMFQQGLGLASEIGDRYQQIRGLIYLALAQLESGASSDEALEHARAATDLARRTLVPMGEIYGLAAQGLALAGLGRAAEGAALTAEAVALQNETEQPEGSEQILHFHARVSEAAGRLDDARDALRRARTEVERKAARLADAALRATYLAAQTPRLIRDAYERLVEPPPPR